MVEGDDGELRPWHYIYEGRRGGDNEELRPWHYIYVNLKETQTRLGRALGAIVKSHCRARRE